MDNRQRILSVARRELRIIRNRPLYFMGSVGVIAFCAIFFLTFLSGGLPDDVPIGIVDEDRSSTSRTFCQQLDATQLGKAVMYGSFASAREDMTRGKIAAVCVIPEGMNENIQAFKQPKITFYVNGLYFVSGALAWKDLLTMVNLTNGAVQREVLRARGVPENQIMGLIRPIDIDTHQIGNVYTNYGYYLSNIMIPGTLELVIIIMIIYTLGMELKYETSRHLVKTAGGSIFNVLAGKLAIYTVLFSAIGLLLILAMYDWLKFPMQGSIWNMFLAIFLLVVAIICAIVLNKTKVGRYILCLGSNREAVRLSGVDTRKWEALAYVFCGTLAGIAAITYVGVITQVQPGLGDEFNNNAIASCVMGGTSMAGGVASIGGTFIGVLIISLLRVGIQAMGFRPDYQYIITGIIVALAVFADIRSSARKK